MDTLPQHIADLIRQGRTIEAITMVREETGVSLAQAKQAVERLAASGVFDEQLRGSMDRDVPTADVEAFAWEGRKIEAIKLLREQTGLNEAKAVVDQMPRDPNRPVPSLAPLIAVAILVLLIGLGVAVFLFQS